MPSDVRRQDSALAQAAERYDAALVVERAIRAAVRIGALGSSDLARAEAQRKRFACGLRAAARRLAHERRS
jgi:hypothetical protein